MSSHDAPRRARMITPVLGAAAVGLLLAGCNAATTPPDITPITPDTPVTPSSEATAPAAAAEYKNGTYAAVGNYVSPAGPEQVDVTLTLQEGIVTDATFKGEATHPTSMRRQQAFADGFKEEVIGKPIDQISLGVVNGSSLAPKGFMDALKKIEVEAKAA